MKNIFKKTGLALIIAATIFSCENPNSVNLKYTPKNEAGYESRIRDAIEKEIGCIGIAVEYGHIEKVKKILSKEKQEQYIEEVLQKLIKKANNDMIEKCTRIQGESYEGIAFPLVSGNLVYYLKSKDKMQERIEYAIKMIGEKEEKTFECHLNY